MPQNTGFDTFRDLVSLFSAKTMISRQIEGVDNAIDEVVYELYNLTEDEIKVVVGDEVFDHAGIFIYYVYLED